MKDNPPSKDNLAHTLAHTKIQPKNPLHGLSLKEIVTQLQAHYGWEELAERIPVRCFQHDPSLKSSLTFLRKTPWAREKVEQLYIEASQNWGKYNRTKPADKTDV